MGISNYKSILDRKELSENYELAHTVRLSEKFKLIELTVRGTPPSNTLRTIQNNVALLISTHCIVAMLLDIRDLVSIEARDRVWICTDWFPIARNSGLKAIFGIIPTRSTAQIIMLEPLTVIAAEFGIKVNWFKNSSDALESARAVAEELVSPI